MVKSIPLFLLLLFLAAPSVATEQTNYSSNDPVYDMSNIRFSDVSTEPSSTIWLASNDKQSPSSKTKILNTSIDNKDCTSLGYEVTLFTPCGSEDSKQLWARTKAIFYLGVGVAGFIALLPEEISKWDKDAYESGDLFTKWKKNVREGPVWDNDEWLINYVGHPYFGGVYYQSARKSGYNEWNSFVYTTLMSTFYWEYGLEAFAEVPSLQELFVTPLGGWVYGEWAYHKEKSIMDNGGYALGSKFWGDVALFFLDPVGVIGGWFGAEHIEVTSFNITQQPSYHPLSTVNSASDYWGITLSLKF